MIWIGTSSQSSSDGEEGGGISSVLLCLRKGSGSGERVREDGGGGDASGVVVALIGGGDGTGGAGGVGPCLLRFVEPGAEKSEEVERFGGIFFTVWILEWKWLISRLCVCVCYITSDGWLFKM
jgi:hypothetical protein